jgi:ribosomal protein S18 acetylase RimI-like enzyme
MLTIKKASLKDYQAIIDIMSESANEEELRGFVPPEGVSPKFLEQLKREISRLDNGVVVAEKEGYPVGFAFCRLVHDSLEIEEIDVRKEFQGQGIGRALIRHVEDVAKERGLKCLVTGTSMNREGKLWKAYSFWIHIGFTDTGERIDGPHGLKYARLVRQL